jgi:hypothetical protein
MWEPRRLTTLWAFTACYRNSFIFLSLDSPTQTEVNGRLLINTARIQNGVGVAVKFLIHIRDRVVLKVLSNFVERGQLPTHVTAIDIVLSASSHIVALA